MRHTRRIFALALASTMAATLALTACSTPETPTDPDAPKQSVTFWTPHVQPERMAAQEAIAKKFTDETGIPVKVVAMKGADQDQALVTGAASGNVPDVILHAPDLSAWQSQGLVDADAAAKVIEDLGEETFNSRALSFVTVDGKYQAVPSDGWVHLIVYRKDLFAKYGIAVPTSLDDLASAATTLAEKAGISGMAMGTQEGTPSATESVESIFLQTGCQLVQNGTVTIDSAQCAHAAKDYKILADSSDSGQFDVASARAAYLAGKAGMLLFSTHILDELAGLDAANPVTCAECAGDPQFLAKNSGLITVLDPSNPAQYGTTLNYVIPKGAHTAEAQVFIKYLLSDGYVDTLATATEGRIPLRLGDKDNQSVYLDKWGTLPMGLNADGNAPSIADIYGADVVTALANGMEAISRWGFGTPDAVLEGAAFSQNVLAEQLGKLYGGTSPEQVVKDMADEVRRVQSDLG